MCLSVFGGILRCCEFVLSLFSVFQVFRVSLDVCRVFYLSLCGVFCVRLSVV